MDRKGGALIRQEVAEEKGRRYNTIQPKKQEISNKI